MTDEVKVGLALLCLFQIGPLIGGLALGVWIGHGGPSVIAHRISDWFAARFEK